MLLAWDAPGHHGRLARRYLQSWFLVDLFTVLPFDTMTLLAPTLFGGVGSGSVVPLDGDRLARCARIGAWKLARVPVMRWGIVRSARVGRCGAPTEPLGVVSGLFDRRARSARVTSGSYG